MAARGAMAASACSSSDYVEVHWVPKECRPGQADSSSEKSDDDEVTVLCAGSTFVYMIPSLDNVLGLPLRQLKIQGFSRKDGKKLMYDVFIRNCRSLERSYPAKMTIKDVAVIENNEFSKSVDISSLKIPPQGVFILWEWLWEDDVDHVSETDSEDIRNLSPSISSCCSEDNTDGSNSSIGAESLPVHTVTFKCIGCTRDVDFQNTLRKVSVQLNAQQLVPVNLFPEPHNPYDKRAIAFKCFLENDWLKIGYVVAEALDDVHHALGSNAVLDVQFAWARYIVSWTRSGPGYFAGINISKRGRWSRIVCQAASTR